MYGNGYYGVLEANYAFAICHFVSAAFGASAWHTTFGTFIPALPQIVAELPLILLLFWTAMLFIGAQMAIQVRSSNCSGLQTSTVCVSES